MNKQASLYLDIKHHEFTSPPSMKHSNCYMVWGGDLGSSSQQARFTQEDLVVGCLIDLATGLMTFTANGKEVNTFYQVSGPQLWTAPCLWVCVAC